MFYQFRHRLNYCIIRISFGSVFIKTGLLHHKWFSESFDGSAATSRLDAMLRFVDYGSILELNSSANRSVEYQG